MSTGHWPLSFSGRQASSEHNNPQMTQMGADPAACRTKAMYLFSLLSVIPLNQSSERKILVEIRPMETEW